MTLQGGQAPITAGFGAPGRSRVSLPGSLELDNPHPAHLRRSILAAGLVAIATWWGLGLPYSLYTWLLDPRQLRWVLFCYAWEVPAAGLLGPVLFPLIWFRTIERRWDQVFSRSSPEPAEIADLEAILLDFPLRVAKVFLITTIVGYGVGALQVRLAAQLPVVEMYKIGMLGLATGLIGGLLAFLYLERLLVPLLRRIGMLRDVSPPAGRRVPLYVKVFASSLILTLTALLLLGPILYSRGERILEEEIGKRVLTEVGHLAKDASLQDGTHIRNTGWWRAHVTRMGLGPSGYAYLVDHDGGIVAGTTGVRRLEEEGFRPTIAQTIQSSSKPGISVDRTYLVRIVAFSPLEDSGHRVIAVAYRDEFAGELDRMLLRGGVVFVAALVLALFQGFLLSRRLMGPIEVVTRAAGSIAHSPWGPWGKVLVRTNDEVGELATTFNQMTARLEEARVSLAAYSAELEQLLREREGLLTREQAARTEAERANLAKDEFLATVSHELRSPLQAILSWVRLLQQGHLEGKRADQALSIIAQSTLLQSQLINDLLDVSRIVSGKLLLQRETVDLHGITRATVEEMRPLAEDKHIALRCVVDGGGVVEGDGQRLHQIVGNLLSNAIKFTPENGRIEVRCENLGEEAVVTVTDSGQGIVADFLPRVFERFHQAEATSDRRHGGLGLGLAIVHHLVGLHGGSVEARSPGPGLGATFSVRLPLVERVS
jgi:signal transduction histidine kinase